MCKIGIRHQLGMYLADQQGRHTHIVVTIVTMA